MRRLSCRFMAMLIMALATMGSCKKDEVSYIRLEHYDDVWLGGWLGAYGSGMDADNGTVYGYSSLANAVRYLDVYFDRSTFFAKDANGDNILPDLGTRYAATNYTYEQFKAMEDDRLFANVTPLPGQNTIEFVVGDVVLFQTKRGKKGLIYIKSLSSSQGDLNIELKVQYR